MKPFWEQLRLSIEKELAVPEPVVVPPILEYCMYCKETQIVQNTETPTTYITECTVCKRVIDIQVRDDDEWQ